MIAESSTPARRIVQSTIRQGVQNAIEPIKRRASPSEDLPDCWLTSDIQDLVVNGHMRLLCSTSSRSVASDEKKSKGATI